MNITYKIVLIVLLPKCLCKKQKWKAFNKNWIRNDLIKYTNSRRNKYLSRNKFSLLFKQKKFEIFTYIWNWYIASNFDIFYLYITCMLKKDVHIIYNVCVYVIYYFHNIHWSSFHLTVFSYSKSTLEINNS